MAMRIKEIRAARGWNQAELAHRADLRIATLSEVERGLGNPTIGTLKAIADALEVSLLDLFVPSDEDVRDAELLQLIKSVDPVSRSAIETLLKQAAAKREP